MTTAELKTSWKKLKSRTGIDQLSSREKLLIGVGSLCIVGILVYQFMISPYITARSNLKRSIAQKQVELQNIKLLQQEYNGLKKEEGGIKAKLARRPKDFTLFTFLDKQAEASKVKEKIKYMKPSTITMDGELDEAIIELKLQEVTLYNLVHFMRLIELSDNVVSIRRLSIQTSSKEQGYLDVVLQIVTFIKDR